MERKPRGRLPRTLWARKGVGFCFVIGKSWEVLNSMKRPGYARYKRVTLAAGWGMEMTPGAVAIAWVEVNDGDCGGDGSDAEGENWTDERHVVEGLVATLDFEYKEREKSRITLSSLAVQWMVLLFPWGTYILSFFLYIKILQVTWFTYVYDISDEGQLEKKILPL